MMLLAAAARSVGCRLLVVDHHRDFADSLAMMLRQRGHEVRVAYDGGEALDVLATFEPQVVLCELRLPGMTGYELAEAVREDPTMSQASLIALSAHRSGKTERHARRAGFDRLLLKPLDVEELDRLLERSQFGGGSQT